MSKTVHCWAQMIPSLADSVQRGSRVRGLVRWRAGEARIGTWLHSAALARLCDMYSGSLLGTSQILIESRAKCNVACGSGPCFTCMYLSHGGVNDLDLGVR
jgi:hypothetical protein